MISVSRLVRGRTESGDSVRFSGDSNYPKVLVFNVTRNCNLRCSHCYSSSGMDHFDDLDIGYWLRAVKEAADMGVKHILLSGGEPLARPDLDIIAKEAYDLGITVELSTNGTMLKGKLDKLKKYISYVGISLDGPEVVHDSFRGVQGAFRKTMEGIRYSRELGLKTGIRFTLTAKNYSYVDLALDIAKREGLQRICFYHLGYAGRATQNLDIDNNKRLKIMSHIIDEAKHADFEVLTADNPVDGVLIYHMTRDDKVLDLLRRNGGNRSGERIADISPNGDVYPDQFTPVKMGHVSELRKIWDGPSDVLVKLRKRKEYLKACSSCPFLDICNGGLRGRALAMGDFWGKDPSCYLQEIRRTFYNNNS
ncbi:radical SAM/SPASM domain-containing protein [Sulfuracidifex metallicus]|uniref:radical SAM/SPASM domain-containing protein n=1 Tax=Sulfuracidifex metallicus TaxID=47303 RepID=UPI002273104F|nr:radical SAM protein [Sulfuracidifex metallicus]MCY0851020.1 radical SAM protein [Sulfuracidifex metallicus]